MRLSRRIGAVLAGLTMALAAFATAGTDPNRTETRVDRTPIPYETVYELSRQIGPGRLVTVRKGEPGENRRVYTVQFRGGRPVAKRLVRAERTDPVSQLIHVGRAGFATSRGSFTRHRILTMEATAYEPSAGRARPTFRTATGRRAEFGVVAVDPRVIPLNSIVFVEGYGMAIAADTGGAIRGMKIDLCVPTRAEALRFGRRRVKVHILHLGR